MPPEFAVGLLFFLPVAADLNLDIFTGRASGVHCIKFIFGPVGTMNRNNSSSSVCIAAMPIRMNHRHRRLVEVPVPI